MMRRTATRMIDRIRVTHLRAMPTVQPWYQAFGDALLRFAGWVLVVACALCMVAGAALLIAKLNATDAQLDTAFLQGMQAGHQLCPRGL